MKEYTSLVESSTGNLTHSMNDLATRGWVCQSVFQSKGEQWIAFMERDIAVTHAKSIGWGNIRSHELPLSEQRARDGDPSAYRATNEPKQQEPIQP